MPKRDGLLARLWIGVLAVVLVCVLFAYAWRLRFLCDDAFISFRYAENLLDGQGLVFNGGERVEGYTNFLWTLQVTVLWGLTGLDPGPIAWALGFLSTLGMVAVFSVLARTSPLGRDASMLLGLLFVSTHRSIAVWTTSGLEQRQFTLWMLAAITLVYLARGRTRFLLVASVALGLAELSRPEVLLYAPCLAAWLGLTGWLQGTRPQQLVRSLGALLGPFALVGSVHVAVRLAYYGYPLPNTFYAKGTEIWPEAGFAYLTGAALEHGWVLLVPLAVGGLCARSSRGDHLHLLSAMMLLPHLAYIVRIGGDHFEYRMLDLAFVLLALATVDGILWIGQRSWVAGGGVTVATLFYANVIPLLHLQAVAGAEHQRLYAYHAPLSPGAGRLGGVPGVHSLLEWHDAIRAWEAPRLIATRRVEHHGVWLHQTERWGGYRAVPRGAFPPKVVVHQGAMGIMPFSTRGLTVIDRYGLTDATVARMDLRIDPDRRRLAHPRRVPEQMEAYVASRVNVTLMPPAADRAEALLKGPFALRLATGLWMPFDLREGFSVADLEFDREVFTALPSRAGEAILVEGDRLLEVVRWLDTFDDGTPGWTVDGTFEEAGTPGKRGGQREVRGAEGQGFVNSYHPRDGDASVGTMRRDALVQAEPGDRLGFLVAGGDGDVGVEIEHPDGAIERIHGARDERLALVTVELRGPTRIAIVDRDPGRWGHVVVDSIMLLRERGMAE